MNWTLEVVVVPVSDLDRAKEFYAEGLGFTVDHDTAIDGMGRIVQLTPPGSGCSIVVGKGIVPDMEPGSLKGLQLVVADVQKARDEVLRSARSRRWASTPDRPRTRWTTSGSSSSKTRTAMPGRSNRSPREADALSGGRPVLPP